MSIVDFRSLVLFDHYPNIKDIWYTVIVILTPIILFYVPFGVLIRITVLDSTRLEGFKRWVAITGTCEGGGAGRANVLPLFCLG